MIVASSAWPCFLCIFERELHSGAVRSRAIALGPIGSMSCTVGIQRLYESQTHGVACHSSTNEGSPSCAIKNRIKRGYLKQNVCLFANAFANEAAASLRSFVSFLIFRVSFGPSPILDYCDHGSQGHERYESDEGKGWRKRWR